MATFSKIRLSAGIGMLLLAGLAYYGRRRAGVKGITGPPGIEPAD